jgi:formate hydrogenlyase subunit 3/multisubunit Na+/H+ antiporter MnhD subunit
MSVSVDLMRDIILVLIVLAVVISFLQELRYRAIWVREAQNVKETLRRLLRSTIVLLLYLIFLCLFLSLTWWILAQPISEMK